MMGYLVEHGSPYLVFQVVRIETHLEMRDSIDHDAIGKRSPVVTRALEQGHALVDPEKIPLVGWRPVLDYDMEVVQSFQNPRGQTFQGTIDHGLEFGSIHLRIESRIGREGSGFYRTSSEEGDHRGSGEEHPGDHVFETTPAKPDGLDEIPRPGDRDHITGDLHQ